MSKALRISADLSLPLDWMSLATVVYGARGSGKTTLGSVIAEEITKARQRFCVIDLKGDWYGLKSSPDGKSDGIPVVVFGGDHADLPLEPDAGAFVGETVAALGQSCILDFEQMSKSKQVHFLAPFFEVLYHKNRDPLLLLLDEAQRYAPQIARGAVSPELTRCLGAVEDLVKLGRKHGIGPMLITQRGSGLNKEVSELCDMLVAFRTPGPLDQDRIKDWLDANATRAQRDDVMGKLSGLDTGTAVFASGHPELKTFGVYQVRRRETFDSSATPKVGQARKEPKVLAKPELDELRAKMSAAIERQKADDPKELRRRIAELERELKAKPAPAKVEKVEVEKWLFDEAAVDRTQSTANEALDKAMHALKQAKMDIGNAFGDYRKSCRDAHANAIKGTVKVSVGGVPVRVSHLDMGRKPRPASTNATSHGEAMTPMDRKFLTALAQYPQGRTRKQVLTLAGYAPSGDVSTSFARLRSNGSIVDEGKTMKISDAGLAALGPFDALPTGSELVAYWLNKLARMPSIFLRILAESGEELPRAELLRRANYAPSGDVSTAFALLRRLELVKDGPTGLRLNEEMFS